MASPSSTTTRTDLSLTSRAFHDGDAIPTQFTCDGADRSPALEWSGAPDQAKSFALIVEDPDAPGGTFIHWVLYDIPGSVHVIPEGIPKGPTVSALGGAKQGRTSFKGTPGYGGPCPPSGTHRYFFRLYALSSALGLAPSATKEQVLQAAEGKVLAQAELMGRYEKVKK